MPDVPILIGPFLSLALSIASRVRITDSSYFCSVPHPLLSLYPPPPNTLLPPLILSALPKLLKPHPSSQKMRRISKIIDREVTIQLTLVTISTMDGIQLCGNWDGDIFPRFGWLEITCESWLIRRTRMASLCPSPPKLTLLSAQTATLLSKLLNLTDTIRKQRWTKFSFFNGSSIPHLATLDGITSSTFSIVSAILGLTVPTSVWSLKSSVKISWV